MIHRTRAAMILCLIVAANLSSNAIAARPPETSIVADDSLGTTVSQTASTVTIGGGTQAGSTLFLSLSALDLRIGNTAVFVDTISGIPIENIIVRVTGADPARISGPLRSQISGA